MTSLVEYRETRRKVVDRARRDRLALARSRGAETSLVDADPVRARAAALTEVGWSPTAIVAMTGAGTPQGLSLIVHGHHQAVERKWLPLLDVPVSVAAPESLPGRTWVPALGAVRRVRGLLTMGWTHTTIATHIGRDVTVFASGGQDRLRADLWRRIDDTFDRLSARPGTSTRNRDRARRAGYLPPLAWDDIDDPHERPSNHRARPTDEVDQVVVERILAGTICPADRPTRLEIIRRWDQLGRGRNDLARLTGWKLERYALLGEVAS